MLERENHTNQRVGLVFYKPPVAETDMAGGVGPAGEALGGSGERKT